MEALKLNRMKELVAILNEAAYNYYQKDREIISNLEYDKLSDELAALESETGTRLSGSPTGRVGYEVRSELVKVSHTQKMLSLDKTKEIEKLTEFLGDRNGLLSWKLDGLTIVLLYEGGELVSAVTRGNGEIGEDVTHNVRVFRNVPTVINFTGRLVIRGEAVISYSDFETINRDIDEAAKYKNPRNLCSGTVRQLNSQVAASRNVHYYAFSVVEAEGAELTDSKLNLLEWIQNLGFSIVETQKITSVNLVESVEDFRNRINSNDLGSDGLVLTFDSISYSASLGATSKFPRDAIAFKWKDEQAETVLLNVIWNTSRTGLINPIAEFEPVELEGTTVSRASVHNVSVAEAMKLGIGDRILVYKANMIIPQIAANLTKSGTVKPPEMCPVCGEATEIVDENDVKCLYCNNPLCKAQIVRALSHFASRDAMNIEGFSIQTIEKFVEKGFIKNYSDIYRLYEYEKEISSLEGFGEKSCKNLLESIEKSRNCQLHSFVYALGIPHVGLANAKLLCSRFDYLMNSILQAEKKDLLSIDGYGEKLADSIIHYLSDKNNLALINIVLPLINFTVPPKVEMAKLTNLTFVITGDLMIFDNRKALSDKIEQLGGKVSSSVSAKTSYLINNNIMSPSSKNKKANDLSIPIITEQEFIIRFLEGIAE